MSSYVEVEPNVAAVAAKRAGGRSFDSVKIVDGDNIVRVLPPFGTNHGGVWFREWYYHFGFVDGEGRPRPLVCTKGTERFCPICEQAEIIAKERDSLVAEYKQDLGDGKFRILWQNVPDNVSAKYKELDERFDKIKWQRKFFYNALTQDGSVKLLQLPKTAAEKLNARIDEAVKVKGFNPLALRSGCWFVIKRLKTGKKITDVDYSVDFLRKSTKTEQGVVDMIEMGPVPENVLNNFADLAYDVHAIYQVRTSQELKKIMLGDMSGWGAKKTEPVKVVAPAPSAVADVAPVAPTTPSVVSTSAPAVTAQTIESSEAEQLRKLREELGV